MRHNFSRRLSRFLRRRLNRFHYWSPSFLYFQTFYTSVLLKVLHKPQYCPEADETIQSDYFTLHSAPNTSNLILLIASISRHSLFVGCETLALKCSENCTCSANGKQFVEFFHLRDVIHLSKTAKTLIIRSYPDFGLAMPLNTRGEIQHANLDSKVGLAYFRECNKTWPALRDGNVTRVFLRRGII